MGELRRAKSLDQLADDVRTSGGSIVLASDCTDSEWERAKNEDRYALGMNGTWFVRLATKQNKVGE